MGFDLKAWLSGQLARRRRRGRGEYGHQNVSEGVSGYMTPKNVVYKGLDAADPWAEPADDPYSTRQMDEDEETQF